MLRAEYGSLSITYEPISGASLIECLQEAQGLAWRHSVIVVVTHNARVFHLRPSAEVPVEEIKK